VITLYKWKKTCDEGRGGARPSRRNQTLERWGHKFTVVLRPLAEMPRAKRLRRERGPVPEQVERWAPSQPRMPIKPRC